jgi:hypothetical protein
MAEFDLLLSTLRESVCVKPGQNRQPGVGIMDSQCVQWGNNRSLNGVDGNTKVKAIKRHLVVDRNGFLIAMRVTVANMADCRAAYLLTRVLKEPTQGHTGGWCIPWQYNRNGEEFFRLCYTGRCQQHQGRGFPSHL